MTTDYEIRLAAFDWLNQQEAVFGDVLSQSLQKKGLKFEEKKIVEPDSLKQN